MQWLCILCVWLESVRACIDFKRIAPKQLTMKRSADNTDDNKPRKGGHLGNNGLTGKPSNNKGKKRTVKVQRASSIDMRTGPPTDDSDEEEQLNAPPITCHMYRSSFIREWLAAAGTRVVEEDNALKRLLGHTELETSCQYVAAGEPPSNATKYHRQKIYVDGKLYRLPPITREGDRNVRGYHYYMYNCGNWSRVQLGEMSAHGDDPVGASHVCGGSCINHAIPEKNSVNQSRKPHHSRMRKALEEGDIRLYRETRDVCAHEPKCFVNPGANNLTQRLIVNNRGQFEEVKATMHAELEAELEFEPDLEPESESE